MTRLKDKKTSLASSDKTDKSALVSSVSFLKARHRKLLPASVSFDSALPKHSAEIQPKRDGSIKTELMTEALEAFSIPPWTPRETLSAAIIPDQDNANLIWPTSPRSNSTLIHLDCEIQAISNPGIPQDVFILACRYCIEVYGDNPTQVSEMLNDLFDSENLNWWREHLKQRLAVPDNCRCVDCLHCINTGSNLCRCSRDIPGPGAAGLWWMDDDHYCPMYRSNA